MAAFYGMGVDNANVEIDGPEVPIMDGSAVDFIGMIESSGLMALPALRQYLVIKKPIRVSEDDKYIFLLPPDDMEFTIDYSIDFAHPFLNKQSFARLFSQDVFRKELGSARTFGFLKDVETLRANGLARGGSLENAIVISDTKILNEGGLRYPDEFVRHKVLDMMGDIALVGAPVIGQLIAYRSGHSLNHKLAQKVLDKPGRWELTESLADKDVMSSMPALLEKLATI
jgi:UDP-3-O-[3-hydroxymyristoyl] N-acetylglucosamine deacetylase